MFFSFSLFVYNKIFLGTHFLRDEIICLRGFAMFWVKIYSPEQNLNTLQQIRIFLCTDTYEEVRIIKELVRSAWDLFIDEGMLRHIQ